MVMSATYRQSSKTTEKAKEKDPLNKYYSHAPRVRLSAEQVRDQALAICGALSNKMYGPSVMPYQPEGIWRSPMMAGNGNKVMEKTNTDVLFIPTGKEPAHTLP